MRLDPRRGKSYSGLEKANRSIIFQCDGIISINPCFEAAMEAIQTRGLARNEVQVERPLPALNLRNSSEHIYHGSVSIYNPEKLL